MLERKWGRIINTGVRSCTTACGRRPMQMSGQGGVCLMVTKTCAMRTAGSMHSLVASPYKSAYNAAKHGVCCCCGVHCRHRPVLRLHSTADTQINAKTIDGDNEAAVLQALLVSQRQSRWRRPRAPASPATPSAPATCSQRWSRTSWRTRLASAASARYRTAVLIGSTADKGRAGTLRSLRVPLKHPQPPSLGYLC